MKTLIKMSVKLLLRTKAFWFFIILTPLLSTVILKSKFDSSAAYVTAEEGIIEELADADAKVAYNGGNGEYLIKVYDAAKSEFSEAMLNYLAGSGLYLVIRVDLSAEENPFTEDYVEYHMKRDGYEDRMGAALYIYPELEDAASAEEMMKSVKIYALSDDKRTDLLKNDIEFYINGYAGGGKAFAESVGHAVENKEVVVISGESGSDLTNDQINNKTHLGYAFAFMTLGFVFGGIFVAHAAIKEKKNGVFTRISLTKAGPLHYFGSKLVTAGLISLMSTFVMGLCSLMLDTEDLGMGRGTFLLMIFLLGLIFCSVSLMLGVLIGDVMSANVAAFTVWTMSGLLSGIYFPLKDSADFIKILSSLMPQTWFLNVAELIFKGDNLAYIMLLCITAAYLLVVISAGSLGIKLRRTGEWGNS